MNPPPSLPSHFSALVAAQLDTLGITQTELARRIGGPATPQKVGDVLAQRILPPRARLDDWLKALEVPAADMARWRESYRLAAASKLKYAAEGVDHLRLRVMQSERRLADAAKEAAELREEVGALRRMLRL